MNFILANGKKVEVSQVEMRDFITRLLLPNAYWRHSGLLTQEEVMRFLKGESSEVEFRKIARYILIYIENLGFTAYLFDKADGEPNRTKEFNIPAIRKLRELYQAMNNHASTANLANLVNEMESACLKIGADPL